MEIRGRPSRRTPCPEPSHEVGAIESVGHGIDAVDGRSSTSHRKRIARSKAMPLEVIGAGFGHTDTMSLKVALEELGFGLLPDD